MDSMYLNNDSVLWLFKPLKNYRRPVDGHANEVKPNNQHHICHHDNSCESHILQVCPLTLNLCNFKDYK